jgi:hypothetical protein
MKELRQMIIDCDSCAARPVHCDDCVISALLGGAPSEPAELDGNEQIALVRLAAAGLLPPLRLVAKPEQGGRRGIA